MKLNINGKTITGDGQDNIGKFNVHGKTSDNGYRLALVKHYIVETGSCFQNNGQIVYIQLEFNETMKCYSGMWYIINGGFSGKGKFEIRPTRCIQLMSVTPIIDIEIAPNYFG
jgi:hypothetical protein